MYKKTLSKNTLIVLIGSLVAYVTSFYLFKIDPYQFGTYIIYFGIASIAADSGYRTRNLVQQREIDIKEALETRVFYLSVSGVLLWVTVIFFDMKEINYVYILPEVIFSNIFCYAYSVHFATKGEFAKSIKIDFVSKIGSSLLRIVYISYSIEITNFIEKQNIEFELFKYIAICFLIVGFKCSRKQTIKAFLNSYTLASGLFMFVLWIGFDEIKKQSQDDHLRVIGYSLTLLSIFYTYYPVLDRYVNNLSSNLIEKLNYTIMAGLLGSCLIYLLTSIASLEFIVAIILFLIVRIFSVFRECELLKKHDYNHILISRILLSVTIVFLKYTSIEIAITYFLIVEYIFSSRFITRALKKYNFN